MDRGSRMLDMEVDFSTLGSASYETDFDINDSILESEDPAVDPLTEQVRNVTVRDAVNNEMNQTIEIDEDTFCCEDDDEVVVIAVKKKSERGLVSSLAAVRDRPAINVNVRKGYIKEIITSKGLGILFSMSSGPVLFHAKHMWAGGREVKSLDREERDRILAPGTDVEFIEMYVDGPEYRCLSQEGFIRQAAAVWIGQRPEHLLKGVQSDDHHHEMAVHRNMMVALVREEAFLAVDVVRATGKIAGYISDRFGIIETDAVQAGEHRRDSARVVFCADDVYIFRRPAVDVADLRKVHIGDLLPPGLTVVFDARRRDGFGPVSMQAFVVLAGNWPRLPHPTLLPGGPGSVVRPYERHTVPSNHTFYYLDISLEDAFDKKWSKFVRVASSVDGFIEPKFMICSRESYINWREAFAPAYLQRQSPRARPHRNYHLFWKPTPAAVLDDRAAFKTEQPDVKSEEEDYYENY